MEKDRKIDKNKRLEQLLHTKKGAISILKSI